jgi:hypothetical protein
MLFLQTGMWGWTRAVTAMRTFERPAGSRRIELEGTGKKMSGAARKGAISGG